MRTISKCVDVDVEVEVDLDIFDDDEIVGEILNRSLDSEQLLRLANYIKTAIGLPLINVVSLDDQMKVDHFSKVFKEYTSAEIERLLP